jgi:hypothetical protein
VLALKIQKKRPRLSRKLIKSTHQQLVNFVHNKYLNYVHPLSKLAIDDTIVGVESASKLVPY